MTTTHPLDLLVGHWNTTGQSVAGQAEQAISIKGTDKYEWLPGRQFLVHTVDVWMGDDKVNVLELIGPCGEPGSEIPMHSFSNDGRHDVMQASSDGPRAWTFASDEIRAHLTIEADGRTMAARWERKAESGSWAHWLDMQFVKTT